MLSSSLEQAPVEIARRRTSPRRHRPTLFAGDFEIKQSSAARHRKIPRTKSREKSPRSKGAPRLCVAAPLRGRFLFDVISSITPRLSSSCRLYLGPAEMSANRSVGIPMTHGNRPARKPKFRLCQSASESRPITTSREQGRGALKCKSSDLRLDFSSASGVQRTFPALPAAL